MHFIRKDCVTVICKSGMLCQFFWTTHTYTYPFYFAVVLQYYEIQVYYSKNVIRGNTAVLKCTIPSFVREYITVTSWIQDSKFNIFPTPKGGKLSLRHSTLYQHDLFNHFTSPPLTCQEDPLASATSNIRHHTATSILLWDCQFSAWRDHILFLLWQTTIGYVLHCISHHC